MVKMSSLENVSHRNEIPVREFYSDIYWDRYYVDDKELSLILKVSEFPRLIEYNHSIMGAATVGEAYKLKEILLNFDETLDDNFKKLINTGTIDPYTSLWGIKKTRYIKASYSNPIVKDNELLQLLPKRFQQAESSKLIIGGMNKRLEVFFDDGDYLAGKSTTIILDDGKLDLLFLLAILNSKLISYWFKTYFGSLRLGGGYLRISNNEIKKIPVVQQEKPNSELIINWSRELLQVASDVGNQSNSNLQSQLIGNRKRIDELVYELYDLTKEEISIVEESVGS